MGWSRYTLDEAGMLSPLGCVGGLAAKVSGSLLGRRRNQNKQRSNRHTVGSPPPQSEQPRVSGRGLARFWCFGAPSRL